MPPQLVESVLAHSADVTILVRSVADAQQLGEEFGPCLQVIAGALDGLQSRAVRRDRRRPTGLIACSATTAPT